MGIPCVTSVRLNAPLSMLHPNSSSAGNDKPLKATVFPKTVNPKRSVPFNYSQRISLQLHGAEYLALAARATDGH